VHAPVKRSRSLTPWWMLAPFLILILLFFVVPVLLVTGMAFTQMDYTLTWRFAGLSNFRQLLADPLLPLVLKNTFVFVAISLLFNVFLPLVLALASVYYTRRAWVGAWVRSVWMLPRITPPVVYVLLWLWLLNPTEQGLLNSMFGTLGMSPRNWILEHPMALISLVNGLVGASFGLIIFSAAIENIPKQHFLAAEVDGATDSRIIRYVILPQLRWPILYVTVWQTLSRLTEYQYILLLTDGGPLYQTEVWSLFGYHEAFAHFQFGYGAAISLVLVMINFCLAFLILRLFRFRRLLRPVQIDS
jgi:inositol-phosphate transport system permease protein